MIIEFHRNMLADKARNLAFYQALQQVIVPGKSVVADIGSGTGLLGFFASKLGAKAVYCYEYSPALKLSQKLAKQNRISNIHFIHNHSTKVVKPVKADIIVSETLGNYAYEENILETVEDAKRFLKPDGVMIPQGITQYIAPVIHPRLYDELCSWDQVGFDLDFSLAKEMTLNNLYVRRITAEDLPDAKHIQRWDSVDLYQKNKSIRHSKLQWNFPQSTTVYGFAMWWESELVKGIKLSTSPFDANTHWEQLYFPILQPMTLNKGERLQISLESDTRYTVGVNIKWSASLQRDGKDVEIQSLDMRKGDIR
jgi:protein arginine N-methyltransferase 1